ncbi:MAG TPA: NAD(P)-dependent glycerol-3-phosphate dehydrogenase [Candidatus Wirthbacteria bacterium]|nr:NAD(P)-dependent glycerol-3-phosphate dehydrogenase [Candidatus Wirthbacteria bacterium]
MPKQKITILGAGQFGTALAWLLGQQGQEVLIYTSSPAKADSINHDHLNQSVFADLVLPDCVQASTDWQIAAQGQNLLICALPVQSIRAFLQSHPRPEDKPVCFVSLSKGLETDTGYSVEQIVRQVWGENIVYGALSGPNFASEIVRQVPTASVFASRDEDLRNRVQDLISNEHFRLYTSDDAVGVEIAGALKNVLAIAVGIHDSLELGHNSRAALVTRGLAEITRLVLQLGGQMETMQGLSGFGDIYLTTTSNLSRNYSLGLLIGQGIGLDHALEKDRQYGRRGWYYQFSPVSIQRAGSRNADYSGGSRDSVLWVGSDRGTQEADGEAE